MQLSPTQRRLYEVLSDGQPHYAGELMRCLADELSERSVLQVHISGLRARLRPARDVAAVLVNGRTLYLLLPTSVPVPLPEPPVAAG